jgi:hypothetical protein
VLSVIGLVLDAIGAIGLTLGLFRGPVASTFGGTRPTGEEITAENRAYGVVGGSFLFTGFLLQVLANVIDTESRPCAEIIAALATTVVGVPLALLTFRVTRPWFLRRLTDGEDR